MLSCRPSIALFGQRSLGFACRSSSLTRLRGGVGVPSKFSWVKVDDMGGHSYPPLVIQYITV